MPTKYSVHTWADGFGLWHARVTGPVPASDGFRRAASRAIRSELEARGDITTGAVIRLTEVYRTVFAEGTVSAEFRESYTDSEDN
jgi:hypothetical protein